MKNKRNIFLVIVALMFTTVACGLGSETEPSPEGVLFQDDFSDPSSGWDRVNVEEGITDYADGVYRILVNTDNTDQWANPGLDFSDTTIKVEATKVGGPDDNDFGVVCRYEDTENFYFFIISSDGFYATGKVFDGIQELLGETEMMPNDAIKTGNATNNIQADCISSRLTFSVNGTQLITVEDSAFAKGDVGLIAGTFDTSGTDIHFDNYLVLEP
ncbi:hypothetical protein ACFLXI_01965 [Chloroflexota bacterium]